MQLFFFLSFSKLNNFINQTEWLFQEWLLSQEKQKGKKVGGGAGREAALTAKPDGFVIRKHNWDGTQAKDKVCWETIVQAHWKC